MNRPTLLLVAIVLFGAALRLVHIESQSLWGDEALTLLISESPLSTLFLVPNDPTPGLYYALHKILIGSGAGLFAARSISLVAGIATILTTFGLARISRIPAIPAAALVALSFPLIDYSQEARAYSLLVLLVILSALAFIWWSRTLRWPAALTFGASILLCFYTHFVSVFWIGPSVAAALLIAWRDRPARTRFEWTLCLMVLMAIPEAGRVVHYPPQAFSWLGQAGPVMALNVVSNAVLPFGLIQNDFWSIGPEAGAVAGLACFGLLGWRSYFHRRKLRLWAGQNFGPAVALAIMLSLPVTIWLFGFIAKPIFMPRTILICIPGFMIALSLILSFERRLVTPAIIGFFALNLAFTGTVRPKEDWRSFAGELADLVRRGDVIVLCPAWKAAALRHAVQAPINAPLLLQWPGGIKQIEPRLGADPNWARTYLNTFQNRPEFSEKERPLAGAKRIVRIYSGCARP